MDAGRHRRAEELFLAARERRPEERAAYLAEACGDEPELRREVEKLLIEYGREGAGAGAEPESSPVAAEPVPGQRSDPLVGHTLGRYRILAEVGRGGMGTVYSAATRSGVSICRQATRR